MTEAENSILRGFSLDLVRDIRRAVEHRPGEGEWKIDRMMAEAADIIEGLLGELGEAEMLLIDGRKVVGPHLQSMDRTFSPGNPHHLQAKDWMVRSGGFLRRGQ